MRSVKNKKDKDKTKKAVKWQGRKNKGRIARTAENNRRIKGKQ